MDPFSHAAIGRTLIACAPDHRQARALVIAGVLGALSPDLDAIVMPFGWDRYLRVHEIGTHSAIGTVAMALLTASLVRLLARRHPMRTLFAAAWLGAASHISLDLLSSARLRVFWPFADHQISVPLVAMADPWLAAILILGAATLSVQRRATHRTAVCVIAIAAAFLAAKAALAARAVSAYSGLRGDTQTLSRVVEAKWASLTEWHVFDRTAEQVRHWRANGVTRRVQLVMTWPAARPGPLADASRALPAVRNFVRVHDLTFAATVEQPEGRQWVLWSDIRFCWNPDRDGAPLLDPVIAAGGARLSCALWFGGEYDGSGRARQQLVKIGSITQRRPVGE